MYDRTQGLGYRFLSLTTVGITTAFLALACGSEEGSLPPVSSNAEDAAPTSLSGQVKALSADARKCIDYVEAKRYVEAIDPCERAVNESGDVANTEVQQAYDEAKAEAQKATQAAAAEAQSDMMEGKSAEDAAKGALDDAAGGLGR
jgi:hypothetical protein